MLGVPLVSIAATMESFSRLKFGTLQAGDGAQRPYRHEQAGASVPLSSLCSLMSYVSLLSSLIFAPAGFFSSATHSATCRRPVSFSSSWWRFARPATSSSSSSRRRRARPPSPLFSVPLLRVAFPLVRTAFPFPVPAADTGAGGGTAFPFPVPAADTGPTYGCCSKNCGLLRLCGAWRDLPTRPAGAGAEARESEPDRHSSRARAGEPESRRAGEPRSRRAEVSAQAGAGVLVL